MKPARSSLLLAFATIYVVWGSTYLGMRVAVETIPPFLMAGARFLVAGVILLGFLRLRGPLNIRAHQLRDNAIIGLLLLLGGNGLVAWSEQYIPSGVTAMILGSQPFFMVLVEWSWRGGKRPNASMVVALLLGFAGVAWLAAPWEHSAGPALNQGGLVALAFANVFWALGSIYSRQAKNANSPFVSAALQMLFGSLGLALVSLLKGEWQHFALAQVSMRSVIAVGYLTAIGSLVGFSTFAWLMKHSTPALVATYAYVNPVVAIFLGWLFLGESIGSRTLVASAIILSSVVIITVQKTRGSPAKA